MSIIERLVAAILLAGAVAGAAIFPRLLAGPVGIQTPPPAVVPPLASLPSEPALVRAAPLPKAPAPNAQPTSHSPVLPAGPTRSITLPTIPSEPAPSAPPPPTTTTPAPSPSPEPAPTPATSPPAAAPPARQTAAENTTTETTTTTTSTATTPTPSATPPPDSSTKPGWGNGDPNHDHSGPPGQQDASPPGQQDNGNGNGKGHGH